MKKIFALCVAIMMVITATSCGASNAASTTASTANTTSTAYTAGSKIGSALKSMYTQYKKDGTLNLKSATNLVNLATLSTSYNSIKGSLKDKTIYKDLASGIIAGSQKTVTESTVDSVISAIGNVDLSSILNQVKTADTSTTSGSNTVTNATSAISSILNILK
ncbi:MAG: hypothetical protein PHD07_00395 [Bacteroidales bacterium]|nr:hypothetical protein [Bacteroidales bacterium]MDD3202009.1 hypothetical protein [Bacteroidales bacterium]